MELENRDDSVSGSSGKGDYLGTSRHETQAISDIISCFTWKFHKAMAEENPGNVAYSPVQVSAGVFALLLGANGSTRDELLSILKTEGKENELAGDFRILLKSLLSVGHSLSSTNNNNNIEDEGPTKGVEDGQVLCSSSQRLFHSSGDSLQEQYVKDLSSYFDIDVQSVDFTTSSGALRKLRTWMEITGFTKEPGVLKELKLDALTRLVMMSTSKFSGNLNMELQYSRQECFFYVNNNQRVPVKMLCAETEMTFAVFQKLDARAVSIPYEGGGYSLLIFLPRGRPGITQLEYNLRSCPNVREMFSEFKSKRKLYFRMPHFSIEKSFKMNDALKSMGAASMFDTDTADFSRLEEYPERVFISAMIQTTHFNVHEKYESNLHLYDGTFDLRKKKCEDSLEFFVEHPFFFMIVDNSSKNVVVAGRIYNPLES